MPVWVVEKHGEILEQWASLKDVLNGKILMSLSWLDTTKDNSTLESKNPLFLPNRKGISIYELGHSLMFIHTYKQRFKANVCLSGVKTWLKTLFKCFALDTLCS